MSAPRLVTSHAALVIPETRVCVRQADEARNYAHFDRSLHAGEATRSQVPRRAQVPDRGGEQPTDCGDCCDSLSQV